MQDRLFRSAALALAATFFGGVFAATAQAAPKLVAGGSVDWGTYVEFRGYVQGPIAKGTITTTGRAGVNPDGTFSFPVRQGYGDPASGELVAELAGGVRFEGHEGVLDTRISQLELRIVPGEPGQSAVYGRLVSREAKMAGPPADLEDHGRVPLVTLDPNAVTPDLTNGWIGWSEVPSTLTEEAVPGFFEYPAGTAFDPVTVRGQLAGSLEPRVKPRSRANVRQRNAVVALVRCGLGPCTVEAPKRARLRIGRKVFRVKVKAPARLGPAKQRKLKVALKRQVAEKLAGREGVVRFRATVRGPEERTASAPVKVKLRGGKR